MLIGIWSGIAYLLPKVGGFGGLIGTVAESAPNLLSLPGPHGLLTPMAWLGFMLCDALGGIMWVQNWVRFTCARAGKCFAALAFIVPIGTTLTYLPATFFGLAGRFLLRICRSQMRSCPPLFSITFLCGSES